MCQCAARKLWPTITAAAATIGRATGTADGPHDAMADAPPAAATGTADRVGRLFHPPQNLCPPHAAGFSHCSTNHVFVWTFPVLRVRRRHVRKMPAVPKLESLILS